MVNKTKKFYKRGLWTFEQVKMAVVAKAMTEEEFKSITGKDSGNMEIDRGDRMSFKKLDFEALKRELDRYKFRQLHIHHTWKPTHKSFKGDNHNQMQQSMKNYHVNTNGWSDIAQNLTLFPDGVWLTGRPFNKTPASIKGWNTGALCVEMIGNFDVKGTGSYNSLGYDKLEGEQRNQMLKLMKYFIDKYGEDSIKFHRENSGKTCPGTSLNKQDMISEAKGGVTVSNNSLIKHGSRGSHVKVLQSNLNKLGFNAGTPDGIAGSNTVSAIKRFQSKYRLTVDGLFGSNSYKVMDRELDKLNSKPTIKPNTPSPTPKKSEYMKIGNAQIIKTKPDNIEIKMVHDTLHNANEYGINGTFFDISTAPVTSPESCVFIAMNDGKALSNNAQFNGWKAPPRATMIYQKNELLGFRKLTDINPIRHITEWAIGGYMVMPYMDFKRERIPVSVNYKTHHSYIAYDNYGYVYLIVKPMHMIFEIVPLLKQLGIVKCIALDGGGSTQLNHPDGSFKSTRLINTAVVLKEV